MRMEDKPLTSQFPGRATLLTTYLRPQRSRVAILAALLLSSIGLQLYNPQILRRFIDSATAGAALQTLINAAILFIVVALAQQLTSVAATYLSENVGWSATNALRADLLRHCLRLDQSFHKSRTPGELIERIDGDVTTLANFFSQLIIQVLGNALLLLGILVVLWGVDWRVGLLFTCFSALVLLTLTRLQSFVVPYWKMAREASADLFGFLEERLAGTEDLRASAAQPYTMRGLYARLAKQYQAERGARLRSRVVWTSADMLFAVATALSLALGAYLFRNGGLTLGTLYSIFFYAGLLWQPLNMMARQAEDFQKASAGIVRVQELFGTRSALEDGGEAAIAAGALPVAFEDVSFSYGDDEPVLDDLSFRLEAGETLGVLGRTGSGKTTLTRLLFRLYDPQRGTIRLGPMDIRRSPLRDLRRRVGIVTQEVQLFHATVRANLTFFDLTIPDERIIAAIDDLGLGPWYRSLPQGLDTLLQSGSGGLSAGEAQLLAFTRIFLRDPGLVILDEASSRLDPATEQLIERAVDKLLRGRTGIIIAHRLETVHRADKILILDHGRIREQGEREHLLRDPDSRFNALLRTGIEEALA
jgi:ABC-type multidrug transport system fused ATPase/permease subunit